MLVVALWLLLFLYVILTLLYINARPANPVAPWPVLKPPTPSERLTGVRDAIPCQSHADCPAAHVCLGHFCIPKLARGADIECDPETGHWTSHLHQGAAFAVCRCWEPRLVDQKFFGGNCDVNVGCGVHGRYDSHARQCECDPGYRFDADRLACRKTPAVDSVPCDKNDVRVSELTTSPDLEGVFHPDYVARLLSSAIRCVKKPCSFDAWSGRLLEHARYVKEWGCVCDPRYGLFGVVLEGRDKRYTNAPGFDACASIFAENLQHPIAVELVTYFYLADREPVSLIRFDLSDAHADRLVPALKGSTRLLLGQKSWRYDYAQHAFDVRVPLKARTRRVKLLSMLFNAESVQEFVYVHGFTPAPCDALPGFWEDKEANPRVGIYALLYQSPVCRVGAHDSRALPLFRGKVVANPLHLTFKEHPHLHRFNAFVLKYSPDADYGKWLLDLDYAYKMDTYVSMDTNAPKYPVELPHFMREDSVERDHGLGYV